MMQEVFYKFLMMIKKIKPEIKYIISGDYNQLKPVNDRISQYTDYSNAPCLFELADFNKLQLTKCRRANDKLYNLIQFKNIPNLKPSDFNETKEYINDVLGIRTLFESNRFQIVKTNCSHENHKEKECFSQLLAVIDFLNGKYDSKH